MKHGGTAERRPATLTPPHSQLSSVPCNTKRNQCLLAFFFSQAGSLFATCGAIGVASLLCMRLLCRHFNDIQLVLGGMTLMIVTCGALAFPIQAGPAGVHLFVVAVFLMYAIGYPIGHTAVSLEKLWENSSLFAFPSPLLFALSFDGHDTHSCFFVAHDACHAGVALDAVLLLGCQSGRTAVLVSSRDKYRVYFTHPSTVTRMSSHFRYARLSGDHVEFEAVNPLLPFSARISPIHGWRRRFPQHSHVSSSRSIQFVE